MKLFAIAIVCLTVCPSVVASAPPQVAATSYWSTLEASAAAIPPVAFDPRLSIQDNNRRLRNRNLQSHLLLSVELQRAGLQLKSLVGRKLNVTVNGKVYLGEVTAFSTYGRDTYGKRVKVYVRVLNAKTPSGRWQLSAGQRAQLTLKPL